MRDALKLHFGFLLSYVAVFYAVERWGFQREFEFPVRGLTVLFLFHYAFFMHFVGTVFRGFSVGVLARLYEEGGSVLTTQVHQYYLHSHDKDADLRSDRIQVMLQSQVIRREGEDLVLTPKGWFAVRLNRFLHRVWNLDYLR